MWSNTFSFDPPQVAHAPRSVAVSAGNLVRCGLFGASTYPKAVPDAVLADYLQTCHFSGLIEFQPTRELDFAHKVVAALPDFSWGWSGVASAALDVATDPGGRPEQLQESRDAAAKAVALDGSNSEALTLESYMGDLNDLVGREALLKKALAARSLACGCEHHAYGSFLQEVGRTQDAIAEYQRGIDVLALNGGSQMSLAMALIETGQADAAKPHIDAAVDLSDDVRQRDFFNVLLAMANGDYATASKTLKATQIPLPAEDKAAWIAGFDALAANDPKARAAAVSTLVALKPGMFVPLTLRILGRLGASRQAEQMIEARIANRFPSGRGNLFLPSFAAARADPNFVKLLDRLGLMRYWRATRTRPDLCKAADVPAFCRAI